MFRFSMYIEGQSFVKELKKYRPLIRIQPFIDLRKSLKQKVLPEKTEKIRKAVIRDWFRFVLWFVRIRKAARASMSTC
jgi:hypothetical protein